MKSCNGIGVFWRVEQKLTKPEDNDDKDLEQLSSFISQGKNTMHWLTLNKFMFSWSTVALLNAGNKAGGLGFFSQIHLGPV